VEQVDRAGLARLVSSISRFLDPTAAVAAASGMEVEVLDARRLGGAWTLDRVWPDFRRSQAHECLIDRVRTG